MKSKTLITRIVKGIIIITAVSVITAIYTFNQYTEVEKPTTGSKDYKDIEYTIDGTKIKLTDGFSEIANPDSTSKTITRYFGNEITQDIDGDSRKDRIFLLTQNAGGTGTFYYVVAALNSPTGFVGSKAFFIGDRISPQSTQRSDDKSVIINYAQRKPEESFTTPPSVGKSLRLIFDPQSLSFGQVENNLWSD